MVQLQLKGNPYQIADSMYGTVLEELGRNDILEPEQSARMRYYYRHLLDPKRSAFFRHHFSQRLSYILKQMGAAGPATTVLDVACGMGTQAILYGLLGYAVTGVDMNRDDIAIARRRLAFYSEHLGTSLNVQCEVADAISFVQQHHGPYNAAIVLEAISHIHPAESFLDNVGNLLVPGGRFIVSDTNALNPLVRLKLFREVGTWRYVVREARDEVTGEVRRYAYKRVFSVPSLGRMLRARGFRRRGALGSGFIPPVVTRSMALFRAAKGAERVLCMLPGHYLIGTSYTLVAQKRKPDD